MCVPSINSASFFTSEYFYGIHKITFFSQCIEDDEDDNNDDNDDVNDDDDENDISYNTKLLNILLYCTVLLSTLEFLQYNFIHK